MFINIFVLIVLINVKTVTHALGTHKWRLMHKQMMDDNIEKFSRNITKMLCPYTCTQLHYSVFETL